MQLIGSRHQDLLARPITVQGYEANDANSCLQITNSRPNLLAGLSTRRQADEKHIREPAPLVGPSAM